MRTQTTRASTNKQTTTAAVSGCRIVGLQRGKPLILCRGLQNPKDDSSVPDHRILDEEPKLSVVPT